MADVVKRSGWWNRKYVIRAMVVTFGLLTVLVGPYVVSCVLLVSPRYGSEGMYLDSYMILGLGFLAVLATPFVLLAGLVCAIFRRLRPLAIPLALAAVVYFFGFFVPASTAGNYRTARIFSLAESSAPLVEAIHRFERETGAPPKTLADLVPDYLPAVPGTGLSGHSDYEYVSLHDAEYDRERYQDNDWALYVDTPSGMLNWDMFLYLPRQNYPERGFAGRLERVGTWAYVDE